ncbi:MAG: HAD-IA family hydrolase [Anaerolineaceae bacterium]|nr:HAD-IA family hydrolase [Anaerolineaceae bacterium]
MIKLVPNGSTIKAIVFDWGDTLMHNFVQFPGRMVEWPQVAAITGIEQALSGLQEEYRLLVATNAAESTSTHVFQALERVNLEIYFEAIFTSNEIGSSKPDLNFFRAIEHAIDLPAHQILMIGDDFTSDILGSYQAGWKNLWYNPEIKTCKGLMPLHNGEIYQMENLPEDLKCLDFPDWKTCQTWQLSEEFSNNLWLHTQAVAALSYQLAIWLKKAGIDINPILSHRGGRLHDLAKITANHPSNINLNHGELAAHVLHRRQQPLLAEIAKRHLLFSICDELEGPQTWEQKLVYLADKFVEVSQVVSLAERMDALSKRYDYEDKYSPTIRELMAEIFEILNIKTDELIPRLKNAMFRNRPLHRNQKQVMDLIHDLFHFLTMYSPTHLVVKIIDRI